MCASFRLPPMTGDGCPQGARRQACCRNEVDGRLGFSGRAFLCRNLQFIYLGLNVSRSSPQQQNEAPAESSQLWATDTPHTTSTRAATAKPRVKPRMHASTRVMWGGGEDGAPPILPSMSAAAPHYATSLTTTRHALSPKGFFQSTLPQPRARGGAACGAARGLRVLEHRPCCWKSGCERSRTRRPAARRGQPRQSR